MSDARLAQILRALRLESAVAGSQLTDAAADAKADEVKAEEVKAEEVKAEEVKADRWARNERRFIPPGSEK